MKKALNSVYDVEWKPRVLIEASAGTGKTYTIAGLFVRLLVEKKLTVDRILVMTFTRKATAELRDRIFKRLRECLKVLEDGKNESSDEFLTLFLEHLSDKDEALRTLKEAVRNFDESHVTTIHGFCQKVLNEEALIVGTPFEMEVNQHDDALTQAAEDYWRQFIHRHSGTEAGRYYTAKLFSLASSPAKLKELVSPLISKSYAEIRGEVMEDPIGCLERIIKSRGELKKMWMDDEKQILDILHHCEISRYQQHLASRLRKLRTFLMDDNYTSDSPESLQYFTSDYLYDESNLKKSGNPTSHHPYFELCSQFAELIKDIDKIKTTLIVDSYRKILELRDDLLNNSTAVTYDDLLRNVQKALRDVTRGDGLGHSLLGKYPFALVDEFQDTDPMQYDIFDSIYPESGGESGLFMIGDPKQAIYGFRGADIYTYFKARKAVKGQVYTLEKNFRSSPRLIEAVNAVFGGERNAFIQAEIDFFDSEPGMPSIGKEFLVDGKPGDHFRITSKTGEEKSKEICNDFAFQHTVSRIAALLDMANKGRVTIRGKKLRAGDIAVLVSGHRDAGQIKKLLKSIGIESVTYSRQQVFETFEAHRLALLMAAVLEPFNQAALNNVLVSGFFGLDLSLLYENVEDEDKKQILSAELRQLNEIWHRHGFYPMFRSVLFREGRLSKLARLTDSERVFTNLYQLADICTKAEKEGSLAPGALHTWFLREKNDPGSDEERTLLLESDQNLVKISTIHNSKGLQFPVVFCPTLWESKKKKSTMIEYHPEGSDDLVIYAGQQADGERALAEEKYLQESVAEEVRKAYVAVTRAKYLCHVIWVSHKESRYSGLGAQAYGEQLFKEPIAESSFDEVFERLSETHPDAVQFERLDEPARRSAAVIYDSEDEKAMELKPYRGRKELTVHRKLESFSSLMRLHSKAIDQPDYDQVMEAYVGAFEQKGNSPQAPTIYNFPRGAAAGTAVHKLFERDEFDFRTAGIAGESVWIGEVLSQHQIDRKWSPVMRQMLADVAGAVLPGIDLSEVQTSERLREMEFHFLSADTESERLFRIIRNEPVSAETSRKATGFMTGFIDLIIRQNGRYYILDYKSNHLGDELSDYEPSQLRQEIYSNGYDLQYHLYTLALAQYLAKRISDFSYESHFGGVAYLFVRGMRAGSSNGVWFHKPDQRIIQLLGKELGVNC